MDVALRAWRAFKAAWGAAATTVARRRGRPRRARLESAQQMFSVATPLPDAQGVCYVRAVPEVLVATPLKSSAVTRRYTFGDGISIRELSPILWDISIAKAFIPAHEQDALANTRYWLCASKEIENVCAMSATISILTGCTQCRRYRSYAHGGPRTFS